MSLDERWLSHVHHHHVWRLALLGRALHTTDAHACQCPRAQKTLVRLRAGFVVDGGAENFNCSVCREKHGKRNMTAKPPWVPALPSGSGLQSAAACRLPQRIPLGRSPSEYIVQQW